MLKLRAFFPEERKAQRRKGGHKIFVVHIPNIWGKTQNIRTSTFRKTTPTESKFNPQHCSSWVWVHSSNPSTQEVKTGRSQVGGHCHPQLHSLRTDWQNSLKFEAKYVLHSGLQTSQTLKTHTHTKKRQMSL